MLTGKRFNGRVLMGDARDDSTRVYEFENPATRRRTWIGWRTPVHDGMDDNRPPVYVTLPARTDVLDTMAVAMDSFPTSGQKEAELDGWLGMMLKQHPVYVTETGDTVRPDLRVDSVWVVPNPQGPELLFDLFAQVTNHGNDSTGTGTPVTTNPNTVVRFYSDDSCLGQIDYSPNIRAGESVTIGPLQWRVPSPGACLVRATVNEKQWYVELGMDDNAAFRRCDIPQ